MIMCRHVCLSQQCMLLCTSLDATLQTSCRTSHALLGTPTAGKIARSPSPQRGGIAQLPVLPIGSDP